MRPTDPSPAALRFYFDFISHNAYLAWARTRAIADAHGLRFEPVPVLFGVLLQHHGQLGPAEIPAKSRWMLRDVLRKARLLGLPLAPPHSHPFNPLPALRLACCELAHSDRLRLIERLWRATWAEGREVSSPAVLQTLVEELGLPAPALMDASRGEAAKRRLRENTDAAIADSVFGVPSVIVRGELFWGYDDLGTLERFLAARDPPLEAGELSAWAAVRPSVQRRR